MKKEELNLEDYLNIYRILNAYSKQNDDKVLENRIKELNGKIMRLRIRRLEKFEGWYLLPNGQFLKVEIKDGMLVDGNNVAIDEEELKNYEKIKG